MPPRRGGQPGLSPFSSEYEPTYAEAAPRRHFVLPGWLPAERGAVFVVTTFICLMIALAGSPGAHPGQTPTPARPTADSAAVAIVPTVAPTAVSAGIATVATGEPIATAAADVPAAAPTVAIPAEDDPRAILPRYRILSYYGHPGSAQMGILGEFELDEVTRQLRAEAEAYEAADPSRQVMPAFELIASVAQDWPGDNDTYLLFTGTDIIQQYVDYTAANGLLLILDIQIGHSNIVDEIDRVEKFLLYPHVQLAIDPEFSMPEGVVPGSQIGGIDAEDIVYAQNRLAQLTAINNLPPKVLIVHQFYEPMIRNDTILTAIPGVQLLIEFDGFGAPANKIAGYNQFIRDRPIQYGGIKLFYRQDSPLMTPADVVGLSPSPDLIIYQ